MTGYCLNIIHIPRDVALVFLSVVIMLLLFIFLTCCLRGHIGSNISVDLMPNLVKNGK